MGQELLNRGVKPHGTLWGASALFNRKYHKTVVKTHLDFIKAGAEIIVTNSFGSRKRRLKILLILLILEKILILLKKVLDLRQNISIHMWISFI